MEDNKLEENQLPMWLNAKRTGGAIRNRQRAGQLRMEGAFGEHEGG